MEIIHTTYEQAHEGGGRTTSTPSSQPERKPEEKKKKVKPKRFLPFLPLRSTAPQSQKSHDRHSDPSSSSRSQLKIPRKAVPVKKSDIRLRDEQGGLSYPVPTPDLRRKGGFYDVSRKEERDTQEGKREDFSSVSVSPFPAQKLGHHVSQTREIPRSTTQNPPPRPINTNTVPLSPRNNYKSKSMETPVTPWPTTFKPTHEGQQKHQKSKSASNKFVEYLRNSADLFEETRREMTGKLSPAPGLQDHLPLPNHIHSTSRVTSSSSGLGSGSGSVTESRTSSTKESQSTNKTKTKAKNKRTSTDSIESFYCAGPSHLEDENKENKPPNSNSKETHTLHLPRGTKTKPTYFSPSPGTVEKLTSSTDVEPRLCRLCNTHPEGIMGLCRYCEEDFTRPNSWSPPKGPAHEDESRNLHSSEGGNTTEPWEEEIKPIPPLKVIKTSSTSIAPPSPSTIDTATSIGTSTSTSPSPILNKNHGPKLGFVNAGKTVINPATRQNSHHVVIVDADEEDDVRYSRYQSEAMRTDAERTRGELKNWASVYGDEMGCHPQKARRRRWGDGVERNTNFYGFYDEILER